jgi:hypothetical protein
MSSIRSELPRAHGGVCASDNACAPAFVVVIDAAETAMSQR